MDEWELHVNRADNLVLRALFPGFGESKGEVKQPLARHTKHITEAQGQTPAVHRN